MRVESRKHDDKRRTLRERGIPCTDEEEVGPETRGTSLEGADMINFIVSRSGMYVSGRHKNSIINSDGPFILIKEE